jgi:hypothetical protein
MQMIIDDSYVFIINVVIWQNALNMGELDIGDKCVHIHCMS